MRSVIKTIVGLAVVIGLLVAFAHWRLDRQTPEGVWEHAMHGIDGAVHVAGNTVLVKDTTGTDGWVALDRRTGKRLAGEQATSVFSMQLGDNGWFVVTSGLGLDTVTTVYDDRGRVAWRSPHGRPVTVKVQSLADDGAVVATYDHPEKGPRRNLIQKIGPQGDVVWRRPPAKGESPFGMTWGFRDGDEKLGDWLSAPRVPAVTIGDKVVRLLDDRGRPVGPPASPRDSVVVGDLLVSVTLEGGRCVVRATRSSGEAWHSSTPCASAPFLPKSIGNLLTVPMEKGDRVLTVDLRTGKVGTAPFGGAHSFDPDDLDAVAVSDQVAVRQERSRFTARDPFTGKQLWTHDGPPPTVGILSNKSDHYPGVEVSGDTVSILSTTTPWWGAFAWGSTVPKSTVDLLDARSGEKLATYRSAELYSMTSTDGGVLLLSDGVLRFIRM